MAINITGDLQALLTQRAGSGGKNRLVLHRLLLLIITLFACGYFLGLRSRSWTFLGSVDDVAAAEEPEVPEVKKVRAEDPFAPADPQHPFRKFRGDTIHAVYASNGGEYHNYQSRIMYKTYQLIQSMEGGSRHTGFTRILHRTVPDYLMDEVPTFHTQPIKSVCDGHCDYPPAERAHALKSWLDAAVKSPNLINGAWILVVESDFVWIRPMTIPGSAWDPQVSGEQLHFSYIQPRSPHAVPSIRKLYNGSLMDIPQGNAGSAILRFEEFMKVVPSYEQVQAKMESYAEMKDKAILQLGWVREMYAWNIAMAQHKDEISVRTERNPYSATIVQPPFDDGLGQACMTHYTYKIQYHEGPPSKGGKQVYRWEKRDLFSREQVLKIKPIPMPPPFRDGLFIEGDIPLTKPRHDLIVLQLAQMNRAISLLPDLTDYFHNVAEPKIRQAILERDAKHPYVQT